MIAVDRATSAVRRLLVASLIVLAALLLLVFAQSYEGRVNVIKSQRIGCARGKLDRADNARGWVAARRAREAAVTDPNVPPAQRAAAREAVRTYNRTIAGLEARSRIDCTKAFPDASVWPW